MSNTAPSRADPVVVFPLGRWCPPQETSQPHPPHFQVGDYVLIKCGGIEKNNLPAYIVRKNPTVVRFFHPGSCGLFSGSNEEYDRILYAHCVNPSLCSVPLDFTSNLNLFDFHEELARCSCCLTTDIMFGILKFYASPTDQTCIFFIWFFFVNNH